MKIKKKYRIEKLTGINNFVFADPHKKEANAHCTHLQIAHSRPTNQNLQKSAIFATDPQLEQ